MRGQSSQTWPLQGVCSKSPLCAAMQAEGEDSGSSSDDDDDDDDGGESGEGPVDMDMDEAPQAVAVKPPRTPIIDADGFQVVQSRRRGNPARG